MISLTRIAEPGLIRRRVDYPEAALDPSNEPLSLSLWITQKDLFDSDAQFGITFFVVRVILFLREFHGEPREKRVEG